MSLSPEEIAGIAHEANRQLQVVMQSHGDTSVPVSPHWDQVPDEQYISCIDGVKYHQENPGVTPEQSHENWCDFKARNGWIYGPVKDEVEKTHPCLVAYDDLPEGQRVKDELFSAIVEALS